ncbi:MAG: hypothetical protein K2X03_25845 [Bryobacteraceae bacterium]|nr:hypothetical protein [Bryobacteraceae bacterium]
MDMDIHEAETRALQGEYVIPAPQVRELGSALGLVHWEEGWEKPLTDEEMAEFNW